MNTYLAVLKKYAVFSGRARRSEYWVWWLINTILLFVLGVIDMFIIGANYHGFLTLVNVYGFATFLPTAAVTVRRLHDTGHSVWWCSPFIIPLVSPLVIAVVPHLPVVFLSWMLVLAGLWFIVLLLFLVRDSQPGPNKYGPNPKDVSTVPAS